MSIIRHEQVNHRGEASRPRVDLVALGALLDRAALGVETVAHCASGPRARCPARRPRTWRDRSLPRCGRSGRSGPGPAGAFRVSAPGVDHDASHDRDSRHLAGPT